MLRTQIVLAFVFIVGIFASLEGRTDVFEKEAYEVGGKVEGKCTASCAFDVTEIVGSTTDPAQDLEAFAESPRDAFGKIVTACTNLCSPGKNIYRDEGRTFERSSCHITYCNCGQVQRLTRYALQGIGGIEYYNDNVRYLNYQWKETGSRFFAINEYEQCDPERGPSGALNAINPRMTERMPFPVTPRASSKK